jgi:hypothetical protein
VLSRLQLERLNLVEILHPVSNCIVEALAQALDVTLLPDPECASLMMDPM